MAAQEERITAVEKAIGELNTNSTILLGLASDHEIDIRRVSVQITELRTELNSMRTETHERFGSLQNDLTYVRTIVDERLDFLNTRIDHIVASLAIIQQSLDVLTEGK